MEEDCVVEVLPGEPPKKKLTGDSGPPVELTYLDPKKDGINSIKYFRRCLPAGKYTGFNDIRNLIEASEDSVQYIDGDNIQFYSGFVQALTTIIGSIQEAFEKKLYAVVLHGTPEVGKSTLAKSLIYYICHTIPLGILTEFQFSETRVSKKMLKFVFTQLVQRFREEPSDIFYVFDGCDTQNLNISVVSQHFSNIGLGKDRPSPYPSIFFTSGHFFPDPLWVNNERFMVNVIHMVPQATDLNSRFFLHPESVTAVQHVLSIIPVYGLSCTVIGNVYRVTEEKAKVLVKTKQAEALRNIPEDKKAVLFLSRLWQGILTSKTLPEFKDIPVESFRLDSFQHAEMSSFLEAKKKDKADKGLNALINWMVPGTEGSAHSSEEFFKVYPCEAVHFWMMNPEIIYEKLIKVLFSGSKPTDLYNNALNFYRIDDQDTSANARKGRALEILVQSYLDVLHEQSEESKYFGFFFDASHESVFVHEVHQSINISKKQVADNLFGSLLEGAVNSAECHETDYHVHKIWVNFVNQFKGYDAAEFQISVQNNGQVKEVLAGSLIQITQNLMSKFGKQSNSNG